MGFVPVDARHGDPVEQILEFRRRRLGGGIPGEEEMGGVMVGIDAVGFQARSRLHPGQEDPRQVISDLARLINPTGRLAVAGVFTSGDAAPSPHGGHADGSLRCLGQSCSTRASGLASGAHMIAGTPLTYAT
jgi:glutathione-independent formaldehyde dehydrogenase